MKRLVKKAEKINIPLEHITWIALFDDEQLSMIRKGAKKGLDVTYCLDPDLDIKQMEWINQGLEEGLDVSLYAKSEFSASSMYYLYKALAQGVDISWYANPEYSEDSIKGVYEAVIHYEDSSIADKLSNYVTPDWDGNKIWLFAGFLLSDFDITELGDLSKYSSNDLFDISIKYAKGEDYSDLLK